MQFVLKLRNRESGGTKLLTLDLPSVPALGAVLDFGPGNLYEIGNVIYSFEDENNSLRVITVDAFLLAPSPKL